MCVGGSGRECKGEVAGRGLEMTFWGAVYGAIMRTDTRSKGSIPKREKGEEGRASSRTLSRKFLKALGGAVSELLGGHWTQVEWGDRLVAGTDRTHDNQARRPTEAWKDSFQSGHWSEEIWGN